METDIDLDQFEDAFETYRRGRAPLLQGEPAQIIDSWDISRAVLHAAMRGAAGEPGVSAVNVSALQLWSNAPQDLAATGHRFQMRRIAVLRAAPWERSGVFGPRSTLFLQARGSTLYLRVVGGRVPEGLHITVSNHPNPEPSALVPESPGSGPFMPPALNGGRHGLGAWVETGEIFQIPKLDLWRCSSSGVSLELRTREGVAGFPLDLSRPDLSVLGPSPSTSKVQAQFQQTVYCFHNQPSEFVNELRRLFTQHGRHLLPAHGLFLAAMCGEIATLGLQTWQMWHLDGLGADHPLVEVSRMTPPT